MREASDQDSLLANHRKVKNKDLKSGKLDKQKRTTRQKQTWDKKLNGETIPTCCIAIKCSFNSRVLRFSLVTSLLFIIFFASHEISVDKVKINYILPTYLTNMAEIYKGHL